MKGRLSLGKLIQLGWQTLGLVLVLLLVINALARWWLDDPWADDQRSPGAEWPSKRSSDAYAEVDWADAYYREHGSAKAMQWVPYVYWRRQAFVGDYINVDQQGRRVSWSAPSEPDKEVWVFGGSAVWGTGVPDGYTLPSLLAKQFEASGQSIRFVNYGESGWVSTQGVIALLRELQRGHRPDAVIFYDGVNDVFAALQSGQVGATQNESHRALDFEIGRGQPLAFVFRHFEGLARLVSPALDLSSIDPETLARQVATTYVENVQIIQSLAQAYDFKAYFFWQPSLFSKQQPSEFEQRVLAASWRTHEQLQRAAHAAVMHALAAHANFFDLSTAVDSTGETRYLDFVHLGPDGNLEVAAAMSHYLKGEL